MTYPDASELARTTAKRKCSAECRVVAKRMFYASMASLGASLKSNSGGRGPNIIHQEYRWEDLPAESFNYWVDIAEEVCEGRSSPGSADWKSEATAALANKEPSDE